MLGGAIYTIQDLTNFMNKFIVDCQKIFNFFFEQLANQQKMNSDIATNNVKFAWNEKLGHVIIDYIDFYIGGEKIDRHLGVWIDVWHQTTGNYYQTEIYNKMIGNVKIMVEFNREAKPEYILYIPLSFWFNRFNGLALPISALQYTSYLSTLKLKNIQD